MKKVIFVLMILLVDGNIFAQLNLEDNIFDYKTVKTSNIKSRTKYIIAQKSTDGNWNTVHTKIDSFFYDAPKDQAVFTEFEIGSSGANEIKRQKMFSHGNLTEFIDMGNTNRKEVYKYNKNNRVIEELIYGLNNESPDFKIKYTYNGNNQILERTENNGTGTFKTAYKYDAKKNLTSKIDFNMDGSIGKKTTYNYDKTNNLISQEEDDKNRGFSCYITRYKYNEKNQKIKETYSACGSTSLWYTIAYTYGDSDYLIGETKTNGGQDKSVDVKKDESMSLVDEILKSNPPKKEYAKQFLHNDDNMLTEIKNYSFNDEEEKSTYYKYDSKKNLIEISEENNKCAFMYEYYK